MLVVVAERLTDDADRNVLSTGDGGPCVSCCVGSYFAVAAGERGDALQVAVLLPEGGLVATVGKDVCGGEEGKQIIASGWPFGKVVDHFADRVGQRYTYAATSFASVVIDRSIAQIAFF